MLKECSDAQQQCEECDHVDYAEDVDLMPGEVVGGYYYCEDCVDDAKVQLNG
jgi:hypothetical protein